MPNTDGDDAKWDAGGEAHGPCRFGYANVLPVAVVVTVTPPGRVCERTMSVPLHCAHATSDPSACPYRVVTAAADPAGSLFASVWPSRFGHAKMLAVAVRVGVTPPRRRIPLRPHSGGTPKAARACRAIRSVRFHVLNVAGNHLNRPSRVSISSIATRPAIGTHPRPNPMNPV